MMRSARYCVGGCFLLTAASVLLAIAQPGIFVQKAIATVEIDGRTFDQNKRLVSVRGTVLAQCPSQNSRTAVILVAGQSNAANYAGQKYTTQYPNDVFSYLDGQCAIAQSPMLGNSGEWGEPWTPLGDRLIESGAFERVIFVAAAIGGSDIARWSKGGELNIMLAQVIETVSPRLHITHVLWQQGESDFELGTTEEHWKNGFASMLATVRNAKVEAPVLVAIASRCDKAGKHWSPDNPVTKAQRAVVNEAQGVHVGVDTDAILGTIDRYDDCHLSASGVEKLVDGWAGAIMQVQRKQATR